MNTDKLRKLFEASTDKYGDAKKMGTTYQNIQNIISGKSDPKVSTIEGIAKFYKVPVGYFFDEATADGQSAKDAEIAYLRGQIKGMKEAIDCLGLSLKDFLINDG